VCRISITGHNTAVVTEGSRPGIDSSKTSVWVNAEILDAIGQCKTSFSHLLVACSIDKGFEILSSVTKNVDGVVLVVEAHKTRRHIAQHMKRVVEDSGGQILGSLLWNRKFEIPARCYRRL
jgi:hypothetical protein